MHVILYEFSLAQMHLTKLAALIVDKGINHFIYIAEYRFTRNFILH